MYSNIVHCLIESKVLGECSVLESRSAAVWVSGMGFSLAGWMELITAYALVEEAEPLCS